MRKTIYIGTSAKEAVDSIMNSLNKKDKREVKMEIFEDIVAEEICNLENHYKKLEELSAIKLIPDCYKINETMESLVQIKYYKKYPNLIWKYPWLGRFCGKTVYMFSSNNSCLYIGSSNNIRQRLKEHLFMYKPNKSFMYINQCVEPNMNFTITLWGFTNFLESETSDFLEKLENILWKYYNPIYG